MNRIDQTFRKLNKAGQKALITFITAGDPDLDTTAGLIPAMAKSGADIIEIGVPFSDPIAEGPVIQDASMRSLQNGTTLTKIFDMVGQVRKRVDIPLLLMMYVNNIFHFGTARFFKLCVESGIDGVIVPDLPYEEQGEILDEARKNDVRCISLVAPTSGDRIPKIAGRSEGFLYCVSSVGVTGMRQSFSTDFDSFFSTIRRCTHTPLAVGFGISTPEQVSMVKSYTDGVIVGSAIVNEIGKHGKDCLLPVQNLVKSLKAAL